MTIQEKNIEIAKMLNWTYIKWNEPEGKYDASLKPGWYSKVPKVFNRKINGHFYKASNSNQLNFNTDANRMFEAVNYIKSLGFGFGLAGNKDKCAFVIHLPELEAVAAQGKDEKECIFEGLHKFSTYLKNKNA